MRPENADDRYGYAADPVSEFGADPWTLGALDFLERSRDVANEVVVDGARRETSTSGREEITHSRSRSPV